MPFVIRCPMCGTATPWLGVGGGLPLLAPIRPGPEPTEDIEVRLVPVKCVQPLPVSRQLRRQIKRSGGATPVCGEEFLVRIA